MKFELPSECRSLVFSMYDCEFYKPNKKNTINMGGIAQKSVRQLCIYIPVSRIGTLGTLGFIIFYIIKPISGMVTTNQPSARLLVEQREKQTFAMNS